MRALRASVMMFGAVSFTSAVCTLIGINIWFGVPFAVALWLYVVTSPSFRELE